MKIVYIFRSLAVWGGIERILVDKMNHLVNMYGHDVFMLTTDQGSHPVPYQLAEGVHHEDLGIQFHRQYQYKGIRRVWDAHQRHSLFASRLTERIRLLQPDIIVCTTADPVYTIAKAKGKTPLVVESHSICTRTLGEKGLRQRHVAHLLRKGLAHASCLVALSEGDALEWRKICPHVRVIPNVVHLGNGHTSTLTNKRVLFVGRFDYQKQPMEIIRIWQEVYPKHPDWQLDIYGEGEQQQQIEQAANRLNMNIHVHQPTEDIFECYRESSILVSTSLFEPFGLVLPEAMSCGVPVVAYDCPYGPAAIITDGTDGFLIASGDRQTFADRMSRLMDDSALRLQLGTNAVESSTQFSASQIMPQWNQLFNEIINKPII